MRKRLKDWNAQNTASHIYFDNDEKGFAIQDAKKLTKLILIPRNKFYELE